MMKTGMEECFSSRRNKSRL